MAMAKTQKIPFGTIWKFNSREDQKNAAHRQNGNRYDRDDLLKLQYTPPSLKKPFDLPDLSIITNSCNPKAYSHVSSKDLKAASEDFHCAGETLEPMKYENYKPTTNSREVKVLLDQVSGVLKEFGDILYKIKVLDINTEEELNTVLDLILEKVVNEPNECTHYAYVYRHLCLTKWPFSDQEKHFDILKKLLHNRCCKEIEQNQNFDLLWEVRENIIENTKSSEKKKHLKGKFQVEEWKIRMRQWNLLRFIAEIFELGVLIDPSTHEYVNIILMQGKKYAQNRTFPVQFRKIAMLLTSEDQLEREKFVHTTVPETDLAVSQVYSKVRKPLSSQEIRKNLDLYINNAMENNEEMFHWIKTNVGENVTKPYFIHTLVTAVIQNAVRGGIAYAGGRHEMIHNKLSKRIPLLSLYLKEKEDLQLQALYAIQNFVKNQANPEGLLEQFFEIFYDTDLVYEEVFHTWKYDNNPVEKNGKEVALLSVQDFFDSIGNKEENV